jgi:hypothetical protein
MCQNNKLSKVKGLIDKLGQTLSPTTNTGRICNIWIIVMDGINYSREGRQTFDLLWPIT